MTEATIPRLRDGAVLSLLGTVGYAGAQWFAFVLATHLCTPEAAGYFGLALAISGPLVLLANLQLSTVIATDPGQLSADKIRQYLGVRLTSSVLALAVSALLAGLMRVTLSGFTIIVLLLSSKLIDAIADVFHGLMQREYRFARVCISQLANAVFSTIGFAGVLMVSKDMRLAALAWLAASTMTLLLVTVPLTRFGPELRDAGRWQFVSDDRRELIGIFRETLPLGLIATLLSLQANIPQYILQLVDGPAMVGRFAALAYPFILGNMLITAVGQAASPRLAHALRLADRIGFRDALIRTTAFGLGLGSVIVLATALGGRFLLHIIMPPGMEGMLPALMFLYVSAAARCACSPVGVAATAARVVTPQLQLRGAVLLVLACVLPFAIRTHSLTGAAVATAVVGAFEVCAWAAMARRLLTTVNDKCAASLA